MKCVILAGGLGTRLAEETTVRPKPMVEIGGLPILWHIMKGYAHYGVREFVICLGFKGYAIKEYFANYLMHSSDLTFDLAETEVFLVLIVEHVDNKGNSDHRCSRRKPRSCRKRFDLTPVYLIGFIRFRQAEVVLHRDTGPSRARIPRIL